MQNFEFGNKLCNLRKAAGLSQTQLGARLHVTNKAVSKWENGKAMPGLDTVRQLADILNVTVDEEASIKATTAFSCLLPGGMPYLHYVLAERNPDTLFNGTGVDSDEKRMRYFIITVIPDTDHPFDVNLPLFHQMGVTGLRCWELTRAILASCREDIIVVLTSAPRPPILNCAHFEWVSLYLGIKPYRGATRLSQQWQSAEEFDGYEADVHLYKLREMPSNPLLQRLIDAYDLDYGIKEGK